MALWPNQTAAGLGGVSMPRNFNEQDFDHAGVSSSEALPVLASFLRPILMYCELPSEPSFPFFPAFSAS